MVRIIENDYMHNPGGPRAPWIGSDPGGGTVGTGGAQLLLRPVAFSSEEGKREATEAAAESIVRWVSGTIVR